MKFDIFNVIWLVQESILVNDRNYDDCQETRDNFRQYWLAQWELQYGMNNYKQSGAAKGKELFIANYEIRQKVSI